MNKTTKKLAVAGILVALGVVLSPLAIPVGASKCFPVQHMVNVLAAVFLGPFYGVIMAFLTSLLRLAFGLGTLLAFPGSMFGALLAGLVYKYIKKLIPTYLGELFGTGVVGGLAAYPMAVWVMGKEAAVVGYILPFLISSLGGTIIAAIIIAALKKTKVFYKLM